MLKNILKYSYLPKLNIITKAYLSSGTSEKWDIITAVCLERKPIVTPQLNEIETAFQAYLNQVEFERSMKSDHEIKKEAEKKNATMKNVDSADVDLDSTTIQTAQDFEDACVEELSKFKFANRITDADIKNDFKSLDRRLDRHLVLLSQQNVGSKKLFLLPQGVIQDGETLKQTAVRILDEFCGKDIKVQFFGNAPCGFYKYKYPKEVRNTGAVGAKIFIYFARYLKGQVNSKTNHMWLDRNEMQEKLPASYYTSVSKFLIDEPHCEIK